MREKNAFGTTCPMPTNLIAALIVTAVLAALLARYVSKRGRFVAQVAAAAAGLLFLLFSSGWTAAALTSPLEYAYPPLTDPDRYPDARAIVLLTGYAADDPAMPLSSRPNSASLYRIVETLAIHQVRPDCPVIISGTSAAAKVMGDLIVRMGLSPDRLQLDPARATTAESVQSVLALVKDQPFFLVTSAGHMPRAMAAFRNAGMRPIAAPTDYQLPQDFRKASILPNPTHLYAADFAVHEYLGLLWYRLRGRL